MLPATNRLRRRTGFTQATRLGSRGSSRTVVAHLSVAAESMETPKVGFVVSKQVGSAVVRNRVKRRLRHLSREWLAQLPAGSTLVVRALPVSAAATSDRLRSDLRRALDRAGIGAR